LEGCVLNYGSNGKDLDFEMQSLKTVSIKLHVALQCASVMCTFKLI